MVKQTISIFLRLKPPSLKGKLGAYDVDEDAEQNPRITFQLPKDLQNDVIVNNRKDSFKFRFNGIFDTKASQEEIFRSVAKPVVDSALEGYNGTVFAYGQTGSGKTFTITGGAERYADRGIIPRVLSHIFEYYSTHQEYEYSTAVSYLEIYNETGYDLLDPKHMIAKLEDLPKVSLFEDEGQNIHLKNLSIHSVNNEMEALNLLFLGDTNRMIAETPMNEASTRSHCIFTIHFSCKEMGSSTVRRAKLHLVDLAGSERVYKTGVNGTILTEAKYINLSLHYLEQVIVALSEKNRSHIPYRNSMMTMVLKDSLGGNCMTTMIATASIERNNLLESISTCRFAQRVALIKNDAILNEELDPQLMIERLKRDIEQLKSQLLLVNGEASLEELSEEEKRKCETDCRQYLQSTNMNENISTFITTDLRRIQLAFSFMREWWKDKSATSGEELTVSQRGPYIFENPVYNKEVKDLQDIIKQRDTEISILVDMLKKERLKNREGDGKSLPQLPSFQTTSSLAPNEKLKNPQTQPPSTSSNTNSSSRNISTHNQTEPSMLPAYKDDSLVINRMKTRLLGNLSLGREEAFEAFKNDYMSNPVLVEQRQRLKQLCAEAKSWGQKLNEARSTTSHIKSELERHHTQRALANGIQNISMEQQSPDKVEIELRRRLEVEKSLYHEAYSRLKDLKGEIEHLQHSMEVAKVKLIKEFENWWEEQCRMTQEKVTLPSVNNNESSSRNSSSLPSVTHSMNSSREDLPRSPPRKPGTSLYQKQIAGNSNTGQSQAMIPLTGDSSVDADIKAFMEARQKLRDLNSRK